MKKLSQQNRAIKERLARSARRKQALSQSIKGKNQAKARRIAAHDRHCWVTGVTEGQ